MLGILVVELSKIVKILERFDMVNEIIIFIFLYQILLEIQRKLNIDFTFLDQKKKYSHIFLPMKIPLGSRQVCLLEKLQIKILKK
jgi:uncharacterized membrane protein